MFLLTECMMLGAVFAIGGYFAPLLAQSNVGPPAAETWAQWGLAGMVVLYTFWRDYQREHRMSQLLQEQSAEHRKERERLQEVMRENETWVRDTGLTLMNSVVTQMKSVELGLHALSETIKEQHP